MGSSKENKLLADIADLRIAIQKLKKKIDVITCWLNSKFDILPVDIQNALSYDDLCTDAGNVSDLPETAFVKTEIEPPESPIRKNVKIGEKDDAFSEEVPMKVEESEDECSDDPLGGLSPGYSFSEGSTLSNYSYNHSGSLKGNSNAAGNPTFGKRLVILLQDIKETYQNNNSEAEHVRSTNILGKHQRLRKRKTYQEKINELLGKAESDDTVSSHQGYTPSFSAYSCGNADRPFQTLNKEGDTFQENFQTEVNNCGSSEQNTRKAFRCHYNECGKEFIYEHSFRSHMRFAHPDYNLLRKRRTKKTFDVANSATERKEFECGKCLKVFWTEAELKRHDMGKHDQSRPYQCHFNRCRMTFLRKQSLKNHMKLSHPDFAFDPERRRVKNGIVGDFKCSFEGCTKTYFKKNSLVNHQRLVNHLAQNNGSESETLSKNIISDNVTTQDNLNNCRRRCQMCHEEFTDKSKLLNHLETHGDNFRCTFIGCGRLFTRVGYLRDHQVKKGHGMTKSNPNEKESRVDISGSLAICPQCGVGCESRELLNEHVFNACYKCKTCRKPFALKCELEEHTAGCLIKKSYYVKTTKDHEFHDENFNCAICQSKFTAEIELEHHLVEHRVKLFYCRHPNCRAKFATEDDIEEHEKKIHCKTCFRSFPHLAHYKVHNDKEHQGQAEFVTLEHLPTVRSFRNGLQCPTCGALFEKHNLLKFHVDQGCHQCEICGLHCKSRTILLYHVRTHEQVKSFLCNVCGRGFGRKHTLQKHIDARHTTEKKKIKCMSCDKVFLSMPGYILHVKVHDEGGKPRKQCTICGFDFANDGSLKSHMRAIHENRRPYACHLCEKSFKTSMARNYHVKTHDNPNGRKRGLNKDVDDLVAAAKRRKLQQ